MGQQVFLRASDVATLLGVSSARVHQLAKAGQIPSTRVGGALRIPKDEWEEWVRRHRERARASLRLPDSSGEPGDADR